MNRIEMENDYCLKSCNECIAGWNMIKTALRLDHQTAIPSEFQSSRIATLTTERTWTIHIYSLRHSVLQSIFHTWQAAGRQAAGKQIKNKEKQKNKKHAQPWLSAWLQQRSNWCIYKEKEHLCSATVCSYYMETWICLFDVAWK